MKVTGRRPLTTDEFINRAKEIHGDLYNYDKTDYKHSHQKVIIGCKEHGDFMQTPNSHLKGAGCRLCVKIPSKYNFQILSEAIRNKHNNTITLLEGQIIDGIKKKYKFKHICGYEWLARADAVFNGNNCPRCSKQIKHTFETLSEAVNNKHNNAITLIENQQVNGVLNKYKFRHICGYEWTAKANHIMNGESCPKCRIYGFKPDKPAMFYILSIDGCSKFTGFGISNDYKSRKVDHKRNLKNNNCSIVSEILISSHGSIIQELEKYVKQSLQCNNSYITGFKTESVLITPKALLDFCVEWLVDNNNREFITYT